jgi:hypothetical protein
MNCNLCGNSDNKNAHWVSSITGICEICAQEHFAKKKEFLANLKEVSEMLAKFVKENSHVA